MELDNTSIAIRERGFLDIMDLALRVIRAHAGPLTLALLAGIVPMVLLNTWLLADYVEGDPAVVVPSGDLVLGFMAHLAKMRLYIFYTLLLVTWEMPLASALATIYLGESLFDRRPSRQRILRNLRASLPQLLVYQVLLRGLPVLVALFAPAELAGWAVLGLMVYWPYLFIWRPYLNEVILLERNPMRPNEPGATTSLRRSRLLHARQAGDLLARWLGALSVGTLLLFSLWGSSWFFRTMLLGELEWKQVMFTHYFQWCLWTVVAFFSVVRFLSYLDLRIRREGWEVELGMRAERARLARRLA